MSLDKIDERIVAALIEDARASYATIGALVRLSAPAVKRRVDRLQESGAIRGFSARVDPAALGWTTEAYVELFCRALTSPADIRAAVRRYPEVVGACTVTGEADALLHIQAADVGHFEQVVERIRAEPFTTRTRSVIVMSRLVDRTGGPMPSAAEGEIARLPARKTIWPARRAGPQRRPDAERCTTCPDWAYAISMLSPVTSRLSADHRLAFCRDVIAKVAVN